MKWFKKLKNSFSLKILVWINCFYRLKNLAWKSGIFKFIWKLSKRSLHTILMTGHSNIRKFVYREWNFWSILYVWQNCRTFFFLFFCTVAMISKQTMFYFIKYQSELNAKSNFLFENHSTFFTIDHQFKFKACKDWNFR